MGTQINVKMRVILFLFIEQVLDPTLGAGQVSTKLTESSPIISKPKLTLVTFQDDEDKKLSCIVMGYPLPEIKWIHNGQVIQDTYRIYYKENKLGSLIKFSITDSFINGKYTCIAFNDLGSDQLDLEVRVITHEIYPHLKRFVRETGNESTNKSSKTSKPSEGPDILLIVFLSVGAFACIILGIAWRVYCFQKCLNHK